jgi:predicted ATPase with chaperone activity
MTNPVNTPPARPRSVQETGLPLNFLAGLALKAMYTRGSLLGHEIADALKLPFANVVDQVLNHLRRERLMEVKGAAAVGESSYRYAYTDWGRARARELMNQNEYSGPAPVGLEAYTARVKAQSLPSQAITPDALRRVLAHLVLSEALLNQLGPAVASGKAIFLFGNTGNGKTSIGEAVGVLPPGAIWIPYVVSVNEQIIKVFDPTQHQLISTTAETEKRSGALRYLSSKSEEYDQRWALIERPFIAVGGELTMKNFNLVYDPTTKDYQAPYQMKANGGIFLLDDFGRQRVQPRNLLNRWIVPLEKGEDYLTLETGQKINVPFDVLVFFATNLIPEDLVDEAYLRRIRYKIYVPDPTLEELREIFRREAAKRDISYSEEGWRYLIAEYYTKPKRTPRGVHPRDILDELVDIARFQGIPPTLSQELLDRACRAYFLQKTDAA